MQGIAVDLVELFALLADTLCATETATTYTVQYTWEPVQARSLRLPPRKAHTQPDTIDERSLRKFLPAVINAVLPVWSEIGYLLASPSFAAADKSDLLLLERCSSVLESCYGLCRLAECDLSALVPPKVSASNNWSLLIQKFNH